MGKLRYYRLFDLLQRRGMKKSDLVEMAGFAPATIAKLSKGDNVTAETLAKLCDVLGVDLDQIAEYEPDK